MKNFLLPLLAVIGLSSYGQDTIFMRSGDRIPSIVKSVSAKEVEYKKANNPDGPSYVTAIGDVESILYRNGTRDKFAPAAPKTTEDYYGSQSSGGGNAPASNLNMSHVKMASNIVFYGLDFTNFTLIEAKRMDEGQKIRDVHFPEWNAYFTKEVPERTMARWLRKSSVTYDNSVVTKMNAQADPSKVVSSGASYGNTYENIKKTIAQYAANDPRKEGIGFVMNVESFDRRRMESSVYFTFFDIATHSVIYTDRVVVKEAQGAGLTNFWGVGLFAAMKDYVDKKYKHH